MGSCFLFSLNKVMKNLQATSVYDPSLNQMFSVENPFGDLFWFHKRHFPFLTAQFSVWNKLTAIQGLISSSMAEISSSVALLFRLTAAVTVTDAPQGFQTRITSAALSHNFFLSGGLSVFIRLIND